MLCSRSTSRDVTGNFRLFPLAYFFLHFFRRAFLFLCTGVIQQHTSLVSAVSSTIIISFGCHNIVFRLFPFESCRLLRPSFFFMLFLEYMHFLNWSLFAEILCTVFCSSSLFFFKSNASRMRYFYSLSSILYLYLKLKLLHTWIIFSSHKIMPFNSSCFANSQYLHK